MKKLILFQSFITLSLLLIFSSPKPTIAEDNLDMCFKGNCGREAFSDMHRDIEHMMRNFFANSTIFSTNPNLRRVINSNYPKTDVYEKDNKIFVSIELPGIDKDKINVEVFEDYVSLKYEEKVEKEEKNQDSNFYISERRYGSFERIIPLPEGAKIEDAKADHKNGVLTIIIPKKEEVKPKSKKLEI